MRIVFKFAAILHWQQHYLVHESVNLRGKHKRVASQMQHQRREHQIEGHILFSFLSSCQFFWYFFCVCVCVRAERQS